MRAALVLLLGALAGEAWASALWQFDGRLAVGGEPAAGVYHHLDGAGRKHLAISAQTVAAVWEDNRSGDPQVYAAVKRQGQADFSAPLQVSSGAEAYEPVIVSLGGDRYALAWEQDGEVHARLLQDGSLSPSSRLSRAAASHVSLASHGERAYAAWRERRDGVWFVQVAELRAGESGVLAVDSITAVEAEGTQAPVQFPSLAFNDAGLCIAWEDRRAGHTRLLVSHSPDAARAFEPPRHLNEFFSNRNQYDKGSGVTRVSLASFGADEIVAAWMDKRRGGTGYGIFAALGAEGGAMFGPNEKVHGEPGDTQPHYNPATAGNAAGGFVVAWDDFRHGDSDVWLSAYNDDLEWGEDFSPTVAGGAGEQTHPAIALDPEGGLHLFWIERADTDAPSRLWYSYGAPLP
jgi:hypothetical protein